MEKEIRLLIGSKVEYQPSGNYIVSENNFLGARLLVMAKAFGGIVFNVDDIHNQVDSNSLAFTNALGEWVADAINQKIKNSKL